MRKLWKILFLAALAAMLLSFAVYADGEVDISATSAAAYDVQGGTGVTVTPNDVAKLADTDEIATYQAAVEAVVGTETKAEDFYLGATNFTVTAKVPAAGEYLIFVLTEQAEPKDTNIAYINQATAVTTNDGGEAVNTVTFTSVYPKSLNAGTTYYIYIVGGGDQNGAAAKSFNKNAVDGSFKYYAPYRLGDVNNDGRVSVSDALEALRIAGLLNASPTAVQRAAADVNKDGNITVNDALGILRYAGLLITSWDQLVS